MCAVWPLSSSAAWPAAQGEAVPRSAVNVFCLPQRNRHFAFRMATLIFESASSPPRGSHNPRGAVSPEKRFVVGVNTNPNEFPRNYYGTHVPSPRRLDTSRLDNERLSITSSRASARPWRDPPVSPRLLPKLRPTSSRMGNKPWGGNTPLPWMVCPDGSMADEMNRTPQLHYQMLMQEAKDAAMADGELDDQEKRALENPKERTRAMLQKSAAQIASDQKIQHVYSDIFHRLPPPGLFYAEAVLQPAGGRGKFTPLTGDARPRWMPAFVSELGGAAQQAQAAAASMPKLAPVSPRSQPGAGRR